MLFVAFLLIAANGFFVATEFALVKVRATRIRQLAEQGNAAAAVVEEMLASLDAYLSACQVGITLASLALGWIGEPAFAALLRPWMTALGPWAEAASHVIAIGAAFFTITVLHIVVGEQAPKIVAIARPEAIALVVAHPMRLFYRLFYPFVQVLNRATQILLAPLGITGDGREGAHTEEEARMILAESLAGGRDSDVR
ncbi:MAG: CNNM domain-containing protein, partial [Candidatus Eisenbacteria bacterium]